MQSLKMIYMTLVLEWKTSPPPPALRQRFDIRNKQKETVETLEDCMESFQKKELLAGGEGYFCEVCNHLTLAEN